MYKTKNPFRNSEKDELVNAVRAVLSGQEYKAPEKEVDEHKGDKPHKHPHEAMDPVNQKAVKKKFKDRKDKDIDNDGDVDDSDKFLHKRRKAISKSVNAENVVHEKWGAGTCIPTMHADPDEDGNIAWYDVMFEHGIETGVPIEELKVTKKAKKEAAVDDDDEDDDDEDEKKKKKNGKKDEVDTEPEIDDEKSTSESMLGYQGADKLGQSKDRNFKSAASHIDYHFRRQDGHKLQNAGERDRLRHKIASKLGYRV